MFDVLSSKKIYHANNLTIFDTQIEGTYPYVVRKTQNNGAKGYIHQDINTLNSEATLSFAQDTFSVFYQKEPYFTGNKIKVLKPKIKKFNQNIALFIVAYLNHKLKNLTWGTGSDIAMIKEIDLQLPIKNGEIDFEFIESFIAELEAQRIAELEAYLLVAGLKDYKLTEEEKEALHKLTSVDCDKYHMGDLFKINHTASFNSDKLTFGDEYDYITRTSYNQGILQSTGFVNEDNINPSGTWSLGLLQMDFFYRKKPWYAGQFIRNIQPRIDIPPKAIPFFTTILNMQKRILLNVLVRDVDKVFKELVVDLPTKNGEIDFEFIKTLVSAVQKLVIKDLVFYADQKIQAAQEVISRKNKA